MSESGTSTRRGPLFCHLTSPDWTVRGPHRGVGASPSPSSTGTSRFTLPLLLLTPPDSAPCPCNLPCDPSARWIPHSFPCRAFFFFFTTTSQYQSPRGACFQDIPWLHRHHRSALVNHVGDIARLTVMETTVACGGRHHSRSIQPNLMRYSAPKKSRAAEPTCGEGQSTPPSQTILGIVQSVSSTVRFRLPHWADAHRLDSTVIFPGHWALPSSWMFGSRLRPVPLPYPQPG